MTNLFPASDINIEHYRMLLQHCNAGIMLLDSKGYIRRINDLGLKLLRVECTYCIGKHFFDVMHFDSGSSNYIDLSVSSPKTTRIVKTKENPPREMDVSISVVSPLNPAKKSILVIFTLTKDSQYSVPATASTSFLATYTFDSIIYKSSAMKEVIRISKISAKSSSCVLITGESGTGKELIAQAIHNASDRATGPFVAINCGSIPANLIESELFGYESGTFTGAKTSGQIGKYELAHLGTLFLDEIGDMPYNLQVSLLRVLQTGEIITLGGTRPKKLDVRVITATNRDLLAAVHNNIFRTDLYYRIAVLTIDIPPLRERRTDIKFLIHYFVKQGNVQFCRNITSIDDTVYEILQQYEWPGNVRELKNAIEWALHMCDGNTIKISDLPKAILQNVTSFSADISAGDLYDNTKGCEILLTALQNTKGNIKRASQMLGIERRAFYRKMKDYNIDPSLYRQPKTK